MEFISNSAAEAVMTDALAYETVRQALIAAAAGAADMPPVVILGGPRNGESLSVKCGSFPVSNILGLKVGGYWPRNAETGAPRHSTSIILIDPDTGRLSCIVRGDRLNGFRTAASDAVATDALARHDAATLAVFGSGHQAEFEVRAICRVRRIQRILIASRNARTANFLRSRLESCARSVELQDPRSACEQADILVTVTPSREPLFENSWIRRGTHISAMGADRRGKRELPLELLMRSRLFADYRAQSLEIGEFQHLRDAARTDAIVIENIGDVLGGKAQGRQSPDEITIYDSSGLAVQDLYIAAEVMCRARRAGLIQQFQEPL
jgi:ornithine cyclodeaminase